MPMFGSNAVQHCSTISKKTASAVKRTLRVFFLLFLSLSVLFLAAVSIFAILSSTSSRQEFGVNFSPYYASEDLGLEWKQVYLDLLDDLGVKRMRLVAYWDRIEKSPDEFDFSDLDWQLEEAQKRNVDIILVIGRKVPRWPECFEPEWVKNQGEDYTKGRLLNFLKVSVGHFAKFDSIKYWQVENEPFFPFGTCSNLVQDKNFVKTEVDFVRSLDESRPVIVQDSGEGGFWPLTYSLGDYLAISMYRRILFDFWILPKEIYFKYPLPSWSYRVKGALFGIPLSKIIVTELQAEPWGSKPLVQMSESERNLTMDEKRFDGTLKYVKSTGISQFYFWGAEWWYWEKTRGNYFYWNRTRDLFK